MRHQRHADLLGNLQRDVERRCSRAARSAGADAHLDADNNVAIGARNLRRIDRRHETHVLALSDHDPRREGINAGEGDMEIGEDAHCAALDHVLAESREIARARAAGIDRGRDARPAAEILGVDAERRTAPVDMRMQIDQPGSDKGAGRVANVGVGIGFQSRSNPSHLALRERDIGHGVKLLRRIDHAASSQEEIIGHCGTLLVDIVRDAVWISRVMPRKVKIVTSSVLGRLSTTRNFMMRRAVTCSLHPSRGSMASPLRMTPPVSIQQFNPERLSRGV
jgi:hypothetical protein